MSSCTGPSWKKKPAPIPQAPIFFVPWSLLGIIWTILHPWAIKWEEETLICDTESFGVVLAVLHPMVCLLIFIWVGSQLIYLFLPRWSIWIRLRTPSIITTRANTPLAPAFACGLKSWSITATFTSSTRLLFLTWRVVAWSSEIFPTDPSYGTLGFMYVFFFYLSSDGSWLCSLVGFISYQPGNSNRVQFAWGQYLSAGLGWALLVWPSGWCSWTDHGLYLWDYWGPGQQ